MIDIPPEVQHPKRPVRIEPPDPLHCAIEATRQASAQLIKAICHLSQLAEELEAHNRPRD